MDLKELKELMPPKRGELLRQWMLRCTSRGLIHGKEATEYKTQNPKAWDQVWNSTNKTETLPKKINKLEEYGER